MFMVVPKSIGLNATDLDVFLRERGPYLEQVDAWR
jgi:hypothetical protein